MHEQESEYDEEESGTCQIRPFWHRSRRRIVKRMQDFDDRHEHEIDILLAVISGGVLTAVLIFGWMHR